MQGLADGYFVIPYTIGNYIATGRNGEVTTDHPAFEQTEREVKERLGKLVALNGDVPVDEFHRRLGKIMWNECGMARNAEGLRRALQEIPKLREEFWATARVPGDATGLNNSLEKAGRVADFLEFAEVMCHDALDRDESCGGHFREEHQTPEGEAVRNDEDFCHATVWEYQGVGTKPAQHHETMNFEYVKLTTRSYK